MKCNKCGAENPEESLFCIECGNPFPKFENKKKKKKRRGWIGVTVFVVICFIIGCIIGLIDNNGNESESTMPIDPVQVTFNNISVEDVFYNGVSGCLFHLNFTINEAQNHRIKVGYTIKDDWEKTIYEEICPDAETVLYQSKTYNDCRFFLPYDYFKYNLSEGTHKLRAYPYVYDIDTNESYQLDGFFVEFTFYNKY